VRERGLLEFWAKFFEKCTLLYAKVPMTLKAKAQFLIDFSLCNYFITLLGGYYCCHCLLFAGAAVFSAVRLL